MNTSQGEGHCVENVLSTKGGEVYECSRRPVVGELSVSPSGHTYFWEQLPQVAPYTLLYMAPFGLVIGFTSGALQEPFSSDLLCGAGGAVRHRPLLGELSRDQRGPKPLQDMPYRN